MGTIVDDMPFVALGTVQKDKQSTVQQLYYDPKTGYISASKLYAKLTDEQKKTITLSDIRSFIKKQESYQVNKQARKTKHTFRHIVAYSDGYSMQMDLLDMSTLSKWNRNYHWIINVIDVYSRKLFSRPMKTKGSTDSEEAIQSILDEISSDDVSAVNINSDNGNEFTNKQVQKLLTKRDINHIAVEVGDHHKMGIVERLNRTMRERFQLIFSAMGDKDWLSILNDVVSNYNNTKHSTIGCTPNDAWSGVARPIQHRDAAEVVEKDVPFHVGDEVRIAKELNLFTKKSNNKRFSKSIYIIVEKVGNQFVVKSKKNDVILERKYKPYEMQLIEYIQHISILANVQEDTREDAAKAELKKMIKDDVSQRKHDRRIKKAGVDVSNIILNDQPLHGRSITSKRGLAKLQRQPKPNRKYHD